ncbi:MAG: C-terminal binding protein [Atopobiaceae bacterium]|jgi:D-3-phosphoglycerate dehydrogenase|nr:C-terminal binding protein [Atopobiaceae bacterium]MCI2174158.1 C-terminal binding protein [Atopobiaceae bacterium]MCI2206799.1 C-terminal binding protein [Atopobiaceae bacterium]
MHRIAYLHSSQPLDYERQLLHEWGVSDVEVYEAEQGEDMVPLSGSLDGADGVVCEWGQVPAHVFSENPQLRVVSVMAIGYDNVDVAAATLDGVYVTNVPGYCTYDVALHTLGLICDLYKKISFHDRQVRAGVWDDMAGYPVDRPKGQTAGLVFFGGIAKALVPMLQAIGMDVIVYAPTKTVADLEDFGCEKADTLDDLLLRSDVVSLHCPLIPETRHIVDAAVLAEMKPSAFLVNTSRGDCVDEQALARALEAGTIRAAAVDVIADEAHGTSPLIGLDNCIVTPHSAYLSTDSYHELRRRAFENALAAVRGEIPQDAVNHL